MKRHGSGGKYARYKRKRNAARQSAAREVAGREGPVDDCPDCGKRMYRSRAAADREARRVHPGQTMRVYPCGGFFHLTSMGSLATEKYRDWQARSGL